MASATLQAIIVALGIVVAGALIAGAVIVTDDDAVEPEPAQPVLYHEVWMPKGIQLAAVTGLGPIPLCEDLTRWMLDFYALLDGEAVRNLIGQEWASQECYLGYVGPTEPPAP